MGRYVEDYKAVADYILTYEEFKKVVPEEVSLFEEKASDVLVFLKLQEFNFEMNDVFDYLTNEDECSQIELHMNDCEKELSKVVVDKMLECVDLMDKARDKFEEKTSIKVFSAFSKANEIFYFEMLMDNVVQLTPQAQALKDSGVDFSFDYWVDEY